MKLDDVETVLKELPRAEGVVDRIEVKEARRKVRARLPGLALWPEG